MKLKLLLILITCIIITTTSKAQTWCSPGATWHYSYSAWLNAGYYKIAYIGDTLINNIQCQILEKTHVDYSRPNYHTSTSIMHEYTYADSNKVYVYRYNQFYTMYDFGANVGDTIAVAGADDIMQIHTYCDSIGKIRVDSIGTVTINGESLRYIYVRPLANSTWGWDCRIVEKIGPLNYNNAYPTYYNYLFPVRIWSNNCPPYMDELNEGGYLKCYVDSSFQFYPTGTAPNCEYIPTSLEEILQSPGLLAVYPNPTHSSLTIKLPSHIKEAGIEIKNMLGKNVHSEHIYAESTKTIDVSAIPNGVYIAQLQIENKIFNKKFVKQ